MTVPAVDLPRIRRVRQGRRGSSPERTQPERRPTKLVNTDHFRNREAIEHCIFGETHFITSSPHFRCFYNNKKMFFIDIDQAISK